MIARTSVVIISAMPSFLLSHCSGPHPWPLAGFSRCEPHSSGFRMLELTDSDHRGAVTDDQV